MTQIESILSLLQSRSITPEEAQTRLEEIEGDGDIRRSLHPCAPCDFRTSKVQSAEPESAIFPAINGISPQKSKSASKATLKTTQPSPHETRSRTRECIAIVGASGRYPDAENLERFWRNLSEGKNSIREVPNSRWDVDTYYDSRRNQSGKIYCKWLGCLEDIDCFDPLFFGISPAEAEAMDPQHRLFLLEAYKAFADAGYSPRSLDNLKCGVYLGIMNSEYGVMLHNQIAAIGAPAALGKSSAIAAGRIAYYLNLKGPAISIDTACSSSLVATHLACQALLNYEVDMALAGGVTLYLTPESYIAMCSAGMLAPDGQCKAFDNSADGFVPGEGAGAVVLKRLSDAEANQDPIRGIIIASGINQDGRTNGITAPSVTSQIELTGEIYRRYQVNPEDISYVEMHGTGTKLGDPIELEALATVFREYTNRKQFCAIGSVKSNIGHTSAAAGMASIHKVLMALEHSALPPTLNYMQPNEHFDFDQSPFRVNTEMSPWVADIDKPRRTAISAFGFSGTNAHLVIEEYVRRDEASFQGGREDHDCLFVLSAKADEQLRALAGLLKEHVESNESLNMDDIAYTLQTGRENMEFRCAFVVDGRQQLLRTLGLLVNNGVVPRTFKGQVKEGKAVVAMLDEDEDVTVLIQTWMHKRKLQKLAELWVRGLEIDWLGLYGAGKPHRIALPCYSFAKQRYWLPNAERTDPKSKGAIQTPVALLHPLVHCNVSTLAGQAYSSTFTGQEFFLSDHQVKDTRVMPGVALLEMALTAVRHALEIPIEDFSSISLKDHVWLRPLTLKEKSSNIQISLNPQPNGEIAYEIYAREESGDSSGKVSNDSRQHIVYAQGLAVLRSQEMGPGPVSVDLNAIQERCTRIVTDDECYEAFQRWGMNYGPAYHGLEFVLVDQSDYRQALARVKLPKHLQPTFASYTLHPSVLDSSLQSAIALTLGGSSETSKSLPAPTLAFSLDRFEQLAACPAVVWAWLRQSETSVVHDGSQDDAKRTSTFDVDLCDEQGRVFVRMRGFRLAAREGIASISASSRKLTPAETTIALPAGPLMLMPVWDVDPNVLDQQSFVERLTIVGGNQEFHRALQERYPDTYILKAGPTDTIQQIAQEFRDAHPIGHILWVTEKPDGISSRGREDTQEAISETLLFGFHLIKALLTYGLGDSALQWTVLTNRAYTKDRRGFVDPFQAGIHGLFGTMAKELPNWNVRIVDLDSLSNASLDDLFSSPIRHRGDTMLYRDRQHYLQKFVPCVLPHRQASHFRNGGVYVVIGGAGRIGEVLTEYLLRTYQARVVWLGRRKMDSEIEAKLSRLSEVGPAPEYSCVDATDRQVLEDAIHKIKRKFGAIHGVIQSTLIFAAQNIAEMEEADFRSRLAAKIDVSLCIGEMFEREPLDFVLFFSSIAAFIRNSNQSHYAAGCAFADALAQNLRTSWVCPVKVMNWGYWEGASLQTLEATDTDGGFRERMRQIGIGFIQPAEAMEAVEQLLAGPVDQLVFVKTTKPDAMENMGLHVDADSLVTLACEESCFEPMLPVISRGGPSVETAIVSRNLVQSFEELLARAVFGQLQSLGFSVEPSFSVTQWKASVAIPKTLDRWLQETLSALSAKGYLSVAGDICIVRDCSLRDMAELWTEWERQKVEWMRDDNFRSRIQLVETTLRALPDILRGKLKSTDVLFPDGSVALVEAIYRSNPVADYLNRNLAETIDAYVELQDRAVPGRRVRLLEIGAGTGGASFSVLQKLEPRRDQIEVYCFTDISKAFLQRAEERLGKQYPYLSCKMFDVEKDPIAQGLKEGTYDVVIAANVLHATRDIRGSLRKVKALLKRSGMLALVEIASKSLFSHLTFGLLDGWWAYEDEALRLPGSPGVSPEMWQMLLEEEGFRNVSLLTPQAGELGQQLVIAESDGVIRRRTAAPRLITDHFEEQRAEPRPWMTSKVAVETSPEEQHVATESTSLLARRMRDIIVDKLANCLKMKTGDIDAEEPFADYGLDSILGIRLVQDLNRDLELDLSVTTLFDYTSVAKLAEHILERNGATVASLLIPSGISADPAATPAMSPQKKLSWENRFRKRGSWNAINALESIQLQPIAIVGMSGRYPESASVDELWEHLAQGHELIKEISRWNLSRNQERRIVGGFLSDIDRFDPSFFNLSGSEAACMDPQQRLFLEEAYKALEDAGYAGAAADDKRCGVYVGYNGGDYRHLLRGDLPAQAMWGNAPSVLSARIAYYLNMIGPAITIDSACSSSLVAIHLASQSLWCGETDMALAGGVSVYCTPSFYESATRADMLSTAGHCYSFDSRADGFVPGEGVGVVVLKRLRDALSDGDHLYGLIRGSGINQDGATNGITAPSALSQERLERSIYERFSIHPEEIQMMEAHGTGTRLGDPIEFEAISRAFRHSTTKKQFCAIGSIKTNIGHATAAAGVAGVIKVLLSLRSRQIPPSLNYEQGNPHINFKDSPFFVNTALKDWEVNERGLRCAAVSSFGMSGTNAHLVIEEFPDSLRRSHVQAFYIVALSARTVEQLRRQVEKLVAHCRMHPAIDCGDMSFTLLMGRKHFNHRAVAVVCDTAELVKQLGDWLINNGSPVVLTSRGGPNQAHITESKYDAGYVRERCQLKAPQDYKAGLLEIAALFAEGHTLPWEELFSSGMYSRISLPTYPFAAGRYWFADESLASTGLSSNASMVGGKTTSGSTLVLHPFLHRNTSDLSEQRFTSHFTGKESLIADHLVQGRVVFPAVGYLEMIRAAIEESASRPNSESGEERTAVRIRNMIWAKPLIVEPESGIDVHISLRPANGGAITFEVFTIADRSASLEPGAENDSVARRIVHAQGQVELFTTVAPTLALQDLKARTAVSRLSSEDCYELFQKRGLEYGPSYCGLKAVHIGVENDAQRQVLAEVILPECEQTAVQNFVLHPSAMDAALQGSIGLIVQPGNLSSSQTRPALPFALDELEIFGPCSQQVWAYIRYSQGWAENEKIRKVDIDICDSNGGVCARLKRLTSRVLENDSGENKTTLLFAPKWERQPTADPAPSSGSTLERWILTIQSSDPSHDPCLMLVDSASLGGSDPEPRQIILKAQGSIEDQFESYAIQVLDIYHQILRAKPQHVVLMQIVISLAQESWLLLGLAGLLKTAQLENPKIVGQLIGIETAESGSTLRSKLDELALWARPVVVRYEKNSPLVFGFEEIISEPKVNIPWQAGGVYLITGGLGGLGLLMAREITSKASDCVLILVGRSTMNPLMVSRVEELQQDAGHVEYRQVDVCDRGDIDRLLKHILSVHGKIDGILHCAGLTRDNFLLNKTAEDLHAVFAPKIKGVLNLDQATRDLPLDIVILFSSVSGALGNQGQADYAAANAFMDAFAYYRNRLARAGERQGHTISINWPLWVEGGMQIDSATRERIVQSGASMLTTADGMKALYSALASDRDQVLVLVGDPQPLRQRVLNLSTRRDADPAISQTYLDSSGLLDKVELWLLQRVSEVLKVGLPDLDLEAELSDFGFDSISLTHFSNMLNKVWNLSLMPTVFFEYPTLRSFANYLMTQHQASMRSHFAIPAMQESKRQSCDATVTLPTVRPMRSRFLATLPHAPVFKESSSPEPIAIIGMSGRFPQASDLDAFWQNLLQGKDCITEIPRSRWDWRACYGDPHREGDKTNVNCGGFIDGVDEFDPLFFGISPRDAALMDPQQRLMMTFVWKAIEDAGYSARSLSGTKTAILIGTSGSDYNWLLAQGKDAYSATGIAPSVGPNRISYLLNIHGPSEPIETACSSSLVAIHRGMSLIASGQCEMAIVGGVNAVISPRIHISFSKAGMLSDDGRCKTFSNAANGYGRGEGVGILLLKGLSAAERDGDHIYGLLRGSAENHGGRANSLTAPNPVAQAEVIKDAHLAAGIDPRTVGYIEVHGTGTPLGDPVEINGLKSAFQQLHRSWQVEPGIARSCGIGSVKTNIGHLELAAGVAGVIKVLLQLQHKTIVKSLHSNPLNPYIQLDGSPFYIVQETEEWVAPLDEHGRELPRRAGVSSFGFGGVNSHVVLEEYVPTPSPVYGLDRIASGQQALILLSAKCSSALRQQATQLVEFIPGLNDGDLADLAYTLQIGRDAMSYRLAFVAQSLVEVMEKLQHFLAGDSNLAECYEGEVKSNQGTLSSVFGDDDLRQTLELWMEKAKYKKLLELWVQGVDVNWKELHKGQQRSRIPLPTYPFANERYWISKVAAYKGESEVEESMKRQGDYFLNHLLDEVLSDAVTIEAAATKAMKALAITSTDR